MKLYINQNGNQSGPFELGEVQSMVAIGRLKTTDYAWHQGLTNWIPLQQVPGIHGSGGSATPRQVLVARILAVLSMLLPGFSLIMLLVILSSHPTMLTTNVLASASFLIAIMCDICYLAAGVALFRLKRTALYLYLLAFLPSLALTLQNMWYMVRLGAFRNMPLTGFLVELRAALSLCLTIAVIAYVWHLVRKGVLT